MSRHNALMVTAALNSQPVLVEPSMMEQFNAKQGTVYEALQLLANADPDDEIKKWVERKASLSMALGIPSAVGAEKPFAFSSGVAIIPIYGMLINRFPYCWGFVTGYQFIQSQLRAALADPDVTLIAFDVNSGGGMASGCEELSQEIFDSRSEKPSIAIVDFSCYSAAYYLASAATRVVATKTSGVGSIGCYVVRSDYTGMMEQIGIKNTVVFAGANKLDTMPLVSFSASAQARMQTMIDKAYAMFCSAVARNRKNLSVDDVSATEASCYDADDALTTGLIDAVASPEYALEAAIAELVDADPEPDTGIQEDPEDLDDPENPDDDEEMAMTPEEHAAAVNAAVAAERTRISGILNCDEAKDKPKFAKHLAENTAMSLDEARGMLKAAAPETAPAAAPAAPVAAAEPNLLETAMTQVPSPGVRQSGGAGDPTGREGMTAAERILHSQDLATGTDNLAKYRASRKAA